MPMRTHTCGELREEHAGDQVEICGWINAHREFGGGLVFIDLRDRHGVTQLVFEAESAPKELIEAATKLHLEDVVRATGTVRVRGNPNPKIPTGKVEVVAGSLEVLAKTAGPPLIPGDEENLPAEETRLRHRYLDLRRPRMQKILATRHLTTHVTRNYFHERGFLEIETPMLTRSTPEGARDFLVPSRHQPGKWYALPQSPQIFKQILMVSGCDRYVQLVRCFRDEDPRADRQAEFTQIDCEMSFVTRDDVLEVMEGMVRRIWGEVLGVDVPPLDVLTWHDAMDRYGIDRPDRRFGLELVDVSDLAKKTDFRVFTDALAKRRGVVKAIRVPGGADRLTRKKTDAYGEFVKQFGAGGLPVTKCIAKDGGVGFDTGVARFLEPVEAEMAKRLGCEPGDAVLFGADAWPVASKALGELRIKLGRDLELIDRDAWNFLWVVDFPMFEYDEEDGRFYAMHHPFTAPRNDQIDAFLAAEPGERDTIEGIVSAGYDMVVNGSEIGGGSIRIHRRDVQAKVFDLLGITREDAGVKFGFLLDALSYGAPPHGGIAFGLDRIVMHLCGTENIREVIAFPKTMTGADLMCEAPGPVDEIQLKELYVQSTWSGGG